MRTAVNPRRSAALLNTEWNRPHMLPLATHSSKKNNKYKSNFRHHNNQSTKGSNVWNNSSPVSQQQHLPQPVQNFSSKLNGSIPISLNGFPQFGLLQAQQPFITQPNSDINNTLFQIVVDQFGCILHIPQIPCPSIHLESSQIEFSHETISKIKHLHDQETEYQPKISVISKVDPVIDDRVNEDLRNTAVQNLRFLHNAFFHLSIYTFTAAISLIDRFVVKVKVRPRYMACLAMACYSIAADHLEPVEKRPSLESLVSLSRCGGSVEDLARLRDIVKQKLDAHKLICPAGAMDFVPLFLGGGGDGPEMERVCRPLLDIALCSTRVYSYSASCLALGLLTAREPLLSCASGRQLAQMCEISNESLVDCVKFLRESWSQFYNTPMKPSRENLVWTLSKRTLNSMTSSSVPLLETITEASE